METSSVYMYLESDELDDVQNIQGQYGSDESDDFDEDWKSYNCMKNIVIFSLELYLCQLHAYATEDLINLNMCIIYIRLLKSRIKM